MATMSVPDRTRANMDVLPETAANGSPSFPFHVCHKNGYFAMDPGPTLDSSVNAQFIFTAPASWEEENGSGDSRAHHCIIGSIPSHNILITPFGFCRYANGYTNNYTEFRSDGSMKYQAGKQYIMVFSAANDGTSIARDVWSITGENGWHNSRYFEDGDPVIFTEDPVIVLGFPTKAQLAANLTNDIFWKPAEDMIIHSMGNWESWGPTAISLTNYSIPASLTSGDNIVGKLFTTHPYQLHGFKYTETGIETPYLKVVGDEIRTSAQMSPGTQMISVETTDNFGKSFTQLFTITVTNG